MNCEGDEEETGLEGGGGVVVFLWTVVTHGLEVSFRDRHWEPDSSPLPKKYSKNKWGIKILLQEKKNPSKSSR